MSASEYRKIGNIYGSRDSSSVRKNNSKTKIQRQKISKIQKIQRAHSAGIHTGPFKIEVEIFGKCRADIDNVLKGVLDALNGVAYLDDSQCVDSRAKLHRCDCEL